MLALETGWTPDRIGNLAARFRSALHWLLYVRALVGPEGLPHIDIPREASAETKADLLRTRVQVEQLRDVLFPKDDE
ncbi:MAG TPA: hypothetical protein VIU37_02180 [Candidatus Limnocylindrales bacterium]